MQIPSKGVSFFPSFPLFFCILLFDTISRRSHSGLNVFIAGGREQIFRPVLRKHKLDAAHTHSPVLRQLFFFFPFFLSFFLHPVFFFPNKKLKGLTMFNSREEWNKYKQKFNSCLPFFLSFNWHGHMVNKSHLVGPTAASTALHYTTLHCTVVSKQQMTWRVRWFTTRLLLLLLDANRLADTAANSQKPISPFCKQSGTCEMRNAIHSLTCRAKIYNLPISISICISRVSRLQWVTHYYC